MDPGHFDLEVMGFPIPSLQFPFSDLALTDTPYETIYGTYGIIFKLDRRVVLKVPILHNMLIHIDSRWDEAKASWKAQKREKRAYDFLKHHPHPHILQCFLTVPEGLFVERAALSLHDRLTKLAYHPVKWDQRMLWAGEIASAAAWIENLGFVHGELRPSNVLLQAETWHVKLAGFDNSVKKGRPMPELKMPYWLNKPGMEGAGAATEQFALASTLFFLEKGRDAAFELTDLGEFVAFPEFEYGAFAFAGLVRRGWERGFDKMETFEREINAEVLRRRIWSLDVCGLVRAVHGAVEYYFDKTRNIMPKALVDEGAVFVIDWMELHQKDPEREAAEKLRKKMEEEEVRASF
ncbi:uncharacterized protein BDZ99DRAFT_155298 [Mytilinidion resinicola]|uniref:Protein kinase domain-containing protein n=1 Tax=Mytilinidion resinicola TaxID=574789 RepID=A0A6A6Y684_9PEZI|nr:uncharacterized protein BDZ99DRAFT_155298 [Mytilinidion resinicola]KAF2804336.1 hypothetical protein BDZ99DRAFT_155298 [Mytilinidion resinicola]